MKRLDIYLYSQKISDEMRPAFILGITSSFLVTVIGFAYFIVVLAMFIGGHMTLPPPEPIQNFAAIVSLIAAPLIVILCASIHYLVNRNKKIFSFLAVAFSLVFTTFVCMNRLIQLSIVRLSTMEGNTEGLSRFLPYNPRSAMFALEITGWGAFLGLALLFLAFAFKNQGISKLTRYTFMVYAFLGIVSSFAFIIDSPLSIIGFVAWGLILYLGTGFCTISLYKFDKNWHE